jgi:transketolase
MINKVGKYALNKLEQRVLEISYKKGLTHIGSCLNAVRLIDSIYQVKDKNDIFILSCGHAALALYVCLEKWEGKNAEELYDKHGTHPNRDLNDGIYCSSGSLGHGIGIAVGMAITNKLKNIYVLSSDGEMAEGSCWEALRIAAELRLENLRLMVVCNGWGAYGKVDTEWLDTRLQTFYPTLCQRVNTYHFPEWLQGQESHYVKMTEAQYAEITS